MRGERREERGEERREIMKSLCVRETEERVRLLSIFYFLFFVKKKKKILIERENESD